MPVHRYSYHLTKLKPGCGNLTSWRPHVPRHRREAEALMTPSQPSEHCHRAERDAEPLGQVISVRGSQVTIGLRPRTRDDRSHERVAVGSFLGIRVRDALLIGMVTHISQQIPAAALDQDHAAAADLDLLGELQNFGTP